MQVGIAERDWIRGVVTEISGDVIGVRIQDPGRFPKTLNGTALARGAVVQDSPAAWTLCRSSSGESSPYKMGSVPIFFLWTFRLRR